MRHRLGPLEDAAAADAAEPAPIPSGPYSRLEVVEFRTCWNDVGVLL